jgi:RNA ligase (TIGR02306 family)
MKLASIEKIKDVIPHPNADKLDIVGVMGYKCIVLKNRYAVGDRIVFIQPDTVLPDKPWAEDFKKKSSRVKAIKLRNEWSFGIVMPLDGVDSIINLEDLEIGEEVSQYIGVIKYEAPAPQSLDAKGALPFGLVKTDEERFQNLNDTLPFDEYVDVTLKIDGSSATYYCKKDPITSEWHTGICSRTLEIKPDCNNKYTQANAKYNILQKLQQYCERYNVSLALRGEIYGQGIQNFAKNPHAKKNLDFAVFSVFNLDKREYENNDDFHYFVHVCESIDVPYVPFVNGDKLFDRHHSVRVKLTPELIQYYQSEIDLINGEPFEGVVVKHKKGSFKIINMNYDASK